MRNRGIPLVYPLCRLPLAGQPAKGYTQQPE
jgi:hypothetical protein